MEESQGRRKLPILTDQQIKKERENVNICSSTDCFMLSHSKKDNRHSQASRLKHDCYSNKHQLHFFFVSMNLH